MKQAIKVGDRVTLPDYTGAGGKNYGTIRDAEVIHATPKFVTVRTNNDAATARMFGKTTDTRLPRAVAESPRYRLLLFAPGQTNPCPVATWRSNNLNELRSLAARHAKLFSAQGQYAQLIDTETGEVSTMNTERKSEVIQLDNGIQIIDEKLCNAFGVPISPQIADLRLHEEHSPQIGVAGQHIKWKTPGGNVLVSIQGTHGTKWFPLTGKRLNRPRREKIAVVAKRGEALFDPSQYKIGSGVQR